MTNMLKLSQV